MVSFRRIIVPSSSGLSSILLGLLDSGDRGTTVFLNTVNNLPSDTVQHPRRLEAFVRIVI
jgi:hypothetical protein